MAERGTLPIQLTLEIPEGATASINVTNTQTPESPTRTLSRGTRVNVAKRYPH